jgi:ribosomal protein S18 acetylase RimI-like enzyme
MRIVESQSLHIREATASDIAQMVPIVNAAFAVEKFIDGTRTDEEHMSEMMRKGTFLIAEDGAGKIAASVYTELRGDRAYFGMLAVDPSRQGSGLGRKMIAAAEEFTRSYGAKHMDITVLSLRPELPPLYRKFGYIETGTEEFRPPRPIKPDTECHAIIMSKAL